MQRVVLWSCTFLICCSCGPNSLADYRAEGRAQCEALTYELATISDTKTLIEKASLLERHFEKLVDLMIAARTYQIDHPDDDGGDPIDGGVQAALQEQLRRLYHLEGGREILERVEREPLIRLDAYERSLLANRPSSH